MRKLLALAFVVASALCAPEVGAKLVIFNFDTTVSGDLPPFGTPVKDLYPDSGVTFDDDVTVQCCVTSSGERFAASQGFVAPTEVLFTTPVYMVSASNPSFSAFTMEAFDENGLSLGSASVSDLYGVATISELDIKKVVFTRMGNSEYGFDDFTFATSITDLADTGSPLTLLFCGTSLALTVHSISRFKRNPDANHVV